MKTVKRFCLAFGLSFILVVALWLIIGGLASLFVPSFTINFLISCGIGSGIGTGVVVGMFETFND